MNIAFLLTPKSQVAYLYNNYTVRQGLAKMRAHGYTAIPVLDRDGAYVGTISAGDFLWTILDDNSYTPKSQEDHYLQDILEHNRENPAVRINASVDELLAKVMEQNFVPVVDDRGLFVGIVTRKDIIRHLCNNKET
jgi:CBS domain-containing protein